MRKLFVFDIDNTLLPVGETHLPPLEKEALHLLHAKGQEVAIASGRNYDGIIQYLEPEEVESTYVIAGNAAVIYGENGAILDDHTIGLDALYYFYNKFQNCGDTNVYGLGRDNSMFYFKEDWHTLFEVSANRLKDSFLLPGKPSTPLRDDRLLKVIVSTIKDDIKQCLLSTKEEERFYGVLSSPLTYEIMQKGIDKAYGAEFLMKKFGLTKNDVYCFGDAGNDLKMIQDFNGVAMGGATEECKNAAKFVALRAEDDGVYHFLKDVLKVI
jgi:Cof subfamily protein (haloacid dehalogenase superfamily)